MSDVAAVEVHRLVKDFKGPFRGKKVRAVDEVSLRIAPGEVYGLIGPNGSGKSTTMKAVLGLVRPTSGSCSIFGRDSLKVDSRNDVGFLPENPYFYKHLTAAETVKFYGKLCGMRGRDLRNRVEEMLELVGLQEPTAGVDPSGSRQIRDLILNLKSRGITVFLCSHLLEQVQEICDRVGIMHEGSLVNEGRLDDLIALHDRTEIVLENASEELLDQIRTLVDVTHNVNLISEGNPRTTLESLFLKETSTKRVRKVRKRISK